MFISEFNHELQAPSTFAYRLVFRSSPPAMRRALGRLLEREWFHALCNARYISSKDLIPALSPVGERVVRDLRKDGLAFVHVSELGLSAEFEELKAYFAGLVQEFEADPEAVRRANPNQDDFLIRLGGELVLRDSDVVTRILTGSQLPAIAGHYLGMVPRFVARYLWRTIAIDRDERINSQNWHRDFEDNHIAKMFLYLNDVTPENGPFEVVSGSHKGGALEGKLPGSVFGPKGQRRKLSDEELAPYAEEMERNRAVCTGPAGTLVIADTYGYHRGGYCKAGVRDLLGIHYATAGNVLRVPDRIDAAFSRSLSTFQRMVFGT